MKHSRVYLEIMLERTTDPIKAAECRRQLAALDGVKPEGRAERLSRRTLPAESAPSLDDSWLKQWLERALPWLSVHSNVPSKGYLRVRLLAGAPLEQLAAETRLVITHGGTDVNVVFPSAAHREFAISFIQARKN